MMKRISEIFLMFLALSGLAHAQATSPTQIVKTFEGDTRALTWEYDIPEESQITHFQLNWVDDLTKTFIRLQDFPKATRSGSVRASFTPGFRFTYYQLVAVDARVTTNVLSSGPSNTIALERIGKPPRNLAIP